MRAILLGSTLVNYEARQNKAERAQHNNRLQVCTKVRFYGQIGSQRGKDCKELSTRAEIGAQERAITGQEGVRVEA